MHLNIFRQFSIKIIQKISQVLFYLKDPPPRFLLMHTNQLLVLAKI